MKSAAELNKNPLIGVMPSETIANVRGALVWLNALDHYVGEAFAGEPIASVTFGRHLLGQCCTAALEAAGAELERERRSAPSNEEAQEAAARR